MERIDFFGSAVFVPIFLVSVGFLLKPSVMIEGETLKLAGLFILAAIGGKAVASFLTKGALRLSTKETLLMLGMTLPQAAATLAATAIGFEIGLFDQSVVNAVLVLILVSIIAATVIVERVMGDVPVPKTEGHHLGKRILVALEDPRQAQLGFAIGARVAAPDGGIVRGLLGAAPTDKRAREAALGAIASRRLREWSGHRPHRSARFVRRGNRQRRRRARTFVGAGRANQRVYRSSSRRSGRSSCRVDHITGGDSDRRHREDPRGRSARRPAVR